jgi:hypothetical protein
MCGSFLGSVNVQEIENQSQNINCPSVLVSRKNNFDKKTVEILCGFEKPRTDKPMCTHSVVIIALCFVFPLRLTIIGVGGMCLGGGSGKRGWWNFRGYASLSIRACESVCVCVC